MLMVGKISELRLLKEAFKNYINFRRRSPCHQNDPGHSGLHLAAGHPLWPASPAGQ